VTRAQSRSADLTLGGRLVMLAYMNHPKSGTAARVSDPITALRAAGWEFASLADQVVN